MTFKINKGVIIFIDALGISQYHTIEQCRDFICKIKRLKENNDYVWKKWNPQFAEDSIILPEPDVVTFQDTIIACFPEPST